MTAESTENAAKGGLSAGFRSGRLPLRADFIDSHGFKSFVNFMTTWVSLPASAAVLALAAAVSPPVSAGPAVTAAICNKYCDGRDAALAPADRAPVTVGLYGRVFKVHVNDTDAMAWGSVETGSPGDEVWLDRSFDGGRTWSTGSKLGDGTIPAGASSRRTGQFNVD